jgi:translation initiation factor 1
MRKSEGGLVYSTDVGRTCPRCRQPLAGCACARPVAPRPAGDGVVRIGREKQGRGGKTVTVVRGLDLDDAALAALGQRLRSACGAGGCVKDGAVEVQGDHAERIMAWLAAQGFRVKRTGGG